jgi:hypothetical protein
MIIKVDQVTAPSHWGNALVNGDTSRLDQEDVEHIDAFLQTIAPAFIVSAVDDSDRVTRPTIAKFFPMGEKGRRKSLRGFEFMPTWRPCLRGR